MLISESPFSPAFTSVISVRESTGESVPHPCSAFIRKPRDRSAHDIFRCGGSGNFVGIEACTLVRVGDFELLAESSNVAVTTWWSFLFRQDGVDGGFAATMETSVVMSRRSRLRGRRLPRSARRFPTLDRADSRVMDSRFIVLSPKCVCAFALRQCPFIRRMSRQS